MSPISDSRRSLARVVAGAIALIAESASPARAAGPPLITDDPGTPDARHWEINIPLTLTRVRGRREIEAPLVDVNYGLVQGVQLKYEAAFLIVDESGHGPRGTMSNSAVGVKWRFLDDERSGVALSTFPSIEFNNPGFETARRRGLVDKGTQVLIPLEISHAFGSSRSMPSSATASFNTPMTSGSREWPRNTH